MGKLIANYWVTYNVGTSSLGREFSTISYSWATGLAHSFKHYF